MSVLLTAAAIEVGKSVAKSIFKFWMKDFVLGEDISSSLIDLVGAKTSDELAQRKGNRQFEDIGDKISEEILPLLEREGTHLDEGERRATAIAVAMTLNKSRLSRELLLEHNLQPTQLMQYVYAANPNATRDLNEDATSLYNRIIKECCTYIIDISSQLPSFTEYTFAEVLKREDLIIEKVGQVLVELHKMREQLDPMREADQFEIEYREAVARNLDVLQLIGADVSLPNRRHKLSVAYITLSVAQQQYALASVDNPLSNDIQDEPIQDIVSVDTALSSSNRLLVRGLAGSGKTTLLQWIAVKAATKSFDGPLATCNECVPFYIRLRHYTQTRLPKPEAFPDFAAPAIVETMPEHWVHRLLKAGQAIVLVDGVDEVSAAQREEVHTWLRDLVETYKDARFVVTSRPHAIEEGWMNNEAFSSVTLQDMELPDISSFIDHWHEAVKQELHTDEEKNELHPLAEYLKEQVRQTRVIRNLATNPLLCAMLCALNRDRRRQLPVNRIELYKACISLLLERREKESRVDVSDYPALNYSQKHRLLEDLAYWMVYENLSEAESAVVDRRFAQKIANMPNIEKDITGRAVRSLLVERAGIIREPTAGLIDFTHRTFQEYFAAQVAFDARDVELLVKNAHNDQWREVIILAAGLATQMFCEQLVRGLIKRGDEEKERRYQIHLVAVSSLETAIELGPEVRAEVEKRLSQLVPPKTMTDAKALAAAGELAVKHLDKKRLTKKGKLSAPICAACIRTLSLIGGDTALDMLEGYANDTREVSVNELLKAWDTFDRDIYAKRILTKTFQNRSGLHLQRSSSLEGMQYLTNLTSLNIEGTGVSDVSALVGLTNLTSLYIYIEGTGVKDVSVLAGLTNLTHLDLRNTGVSDVSALAGLTNLTSLYLTRLYPLTGQKTEGRVRFSRT